MNTFQFLGALELGLIYSLVSLGVYLTFRVIQFADMTVDGSFPLGGAVCSCLLISGVNPWLATSASVVAGALAGWFTSQLHLRFRIFDLLSGILNMTALYSINLRIMGKPNIALWGQSTILGSKFQTLVTLVIFVALTLLVIWRFLSSELGLALQATGLNSKASAAYGINTNLTKTIGLSLSNAIVALAGALFAQAQGFSDISMGTGTLVIGLASLIVGQTLLTNRRQVLTLLSLIIGSIIYRIAVAIALNSSVVGLKPSDLNLITAILVVVAITAGQSKREKT